MCWQRVSAGCGVGAWAIAWLGGCAPTAYDFIHDKTGIEVAREVKICAGGVLRDDPTCRPSGRGGAAWQRNENFDIYNLQRPINLASWPSAIEEISVRYLGTPHWNERIQPSCKEELPEASLPVHADVSVDSIDLTAKLQQETTQQFSFDMMVRLQQAGFPVNPGVEMRFRDFLARAVEQRMRARLLWFVATYPGGRYAIETNPAFTRCRQAVHDHERDGAKFVSGVAGFIVLENFADTSINSDAALNEALAAVVGPVYPHVVDARMKASWRRTVHRVVRVEAQTQSLTQTVYPLWIQFE